MLARHEATGEPLPLPLCEKLAAGRRAMGALELQTQVLLSLVDQQYFGPGPMADTSAAWQAAWDQYSPVPFVPGTHPQARFSHFTIYGATYYSYMYARCLSAQLWAKYLAADPLDPGAGEQIRRLLLEPGGAREPHDMMADLLGPSGLTAAHGGWAPSLHDQALLNSGVLTMF